MPTLPLDSPKADSYVRFLDSGVWKYVHLVQRYSPLRYPRRLESLAPGAQSNNTTVFSELDPASTRNHMYLVYLGCYPEFLYEIWQPTDWRNGAWDERVTDIDEELTRNVTFQDSPYFEPKIGIWVSRGRYPALRLRNVGRATAVGQALFVGIKYLITEHDDIDVATRDKLEQGELESLPIHFGGDW